MLKSILIILLPMLTQVITTTITKNDCNYEKFRTITCNHITTEYLFSTGLFTAKHMYRQFICIDCNLGTIPSYTFNVKSNEGETAAFIILDLTDCNVTGFENKTFFGQEVLRRLILRRNSIVNVAGMFEPLKHLELLDLGYNRVEVLKKGGFSGLLHLTVLNLEGNRIREIEDEAFAGLDNVQLLKLDRNRIKELDGDALSGLVAVEALSVQFNLIESINYDAFANFSYLNQLDLENNRLKEISEELLKKATTVKKLDISSNPLQVISSKALTSNSLEELYMKNCSLPMVKNLFVNLPNLRILSLANNALTDVSLESFAKLKLLTTLNLSTNSISHIRCSNSTLPSLKSLDCDDNQIADFDYVCIFGKIPNLKNIDLIGNPLPQYLYIEMIEYLYGYNASSRGFADGVVKNSAITSSVTSDLSLKPVYVCFGLVFVVLVALIAFLYKLTLSLKHLNSTVKVSNLPLLQDM